MSTRPACQENSNITIFRFCLICFLLNTVYPVSVNAKFSGLTIPPDWHLGAVFNPMNNVALLKSLPGSFDWRSQCTTVKDQGNVGSCWAFSAVGPLECNILIKDGIAVDLSEQWLVSCNWDSMDCIYGGWPYRALGYFISKSGHCGHSGAVLEMDFPYAEAQVPCTPTHGHTHPYKITGYGYVGSFGSGSRDESLKRAIMKYGPISCCMYVASGDPWEKPNHAVVLVGWQDDPDAVNGGHWIVRNSYGPEKHDNGYFYQPYETSKIGYAACYVIYPGIVTPPPSDLTYTITDLDTLDGVEFGPSGINDEGQVVGCCQTSSSPPTSLALLWDSENGVEDIGTLGGSWNMASGINNLGQVVGRSSIGGVGDAYHAFLWLPEPAYGMPAGMNDLGTLGGSSTAYNINDSGQIVGFSDIGGLGDGYHAFLWLPEPAYGMPAGMNDLNNLIRTFCGSEINSKACDINHSGQIVGRGYTLTGDSSPTFSFIWLPEPAYGKTAGIYFLGTLGGTSEIAESINNHGQIVGWTGSITDEHAFLWLPEPDYGKNAGMHDIGGFGEPSRRSRAKDINDSGQIVGYANTSTGSWYAFRWDLGKMTNLNSVIDLNSGWNLQYAYAINNKGQIAGNGKSDLPDGRTWGVFRLSPEHAMAPDIERGESRMITTNIENTDIYFTSQATSTVGLNAWGVDTNIHPHHAGNWTTLDSLVRVTTAASDCDFKMVVRVSYEGMPDITENYLDLVSYEVDPNQWQLAVMGNSPGTTTRYVSSVPGEFAPGITDIADLSLGDYGINIEDDFVWAVVDHASDFAPGYRVSGTIVVCMNGTGDYTTIQEGLDAAIDGDEVVVRDGTYTGTGNKNLSFNGKEITLRSENGPANCIIDCKGNGRGIDLNSGEGPLSVVDGLTIRNGDATSGGMPDYIGGGIRCVSSSPTIANCIFNSNEAIGGGGIGIYFGSPTVSHCTFTENLTHGDGGGLVVALAQLTVTDCIFIDNLVMSTGGDGGAIANNASNTTVINTIIAGNYARAGGGIRSGGGGRLDVINCTITGNSSIYEMGCGIYGSADRLEMSNCILWSNTNNTVTGEIAQIHVYQKETVNVNYCCIEEWTGYLGGIGNIDENPLFASLGYWDDDTWVTGDYHLKSQAGRWENGVWIMDDVTSRCIDVGNPGTPLGDEANGSDNVRINMGAYGGTVEASKTPTGWSLLADLTNDGTVDMQDLKSQLQDWLHTHDQMPGDLNRDGYITLNDLALLAADWLSTTTWH